VIIDGVHECVPNPQEHTPEYLLGLKYGTMDGQVGIYDLAAACGKYHGTAFDHCSFGYRTTYVTNCLNSKFGCGDGPTTLPEPTLHASNFTATTPTSGTNFTILASGGKGTGSTCVGNCTTGTPPSVDCTKTPNDPSCVTKPATPTQTCPDGSVIAATDLCPTPPTTSNNPAPNNNPTPPPSNTPPSDNGQSGTGNNNPPPSPDNSNPPPSNNPPSSSNGGNGGNGRNG